MHERGAREPSSHSFLNLTQAHTLARVSQGNKPVAELIRESVTFARTKCCDTAAVDLVEQVLTTIVCLSPISCIAPAQSPPTT